MSVHEVYIQALEVCKRARDQEKHCIAIQAKRGGGFRLMTVNTSYVGTICHDLGFGTVEWAQNLVYRLVNESLTNFTANDVDTYFARLRV